MILLSIFITISIFSNLVDLAPIDHNESKTFQFIILHNNDIHGRFEQTDRDSEICTQELATANKCYGGVARTAHVVRKYREEAKKPGGKPVIFLNAGDTFTGTVWFTLFKSKISSKFLNLLQPDASTLGNHEFDLGVNQLRKYLLDIKFPVVISNLDLSKTPKLETLLMKTKVLEINNVKIGIVGYLTPNTMFEAAVGDVVITPEIEAINAAASKLKTDGIRIIIGLGHSGVEMDKKIASKCPDIDIVVGSHTHTFLYNGTAPDIEVPQDTYPIIIEQSNGKKVPVVQAYSFTKYLGYLEVEFDLDGNLLKWSGNPILLNSTIPEDEDILKELEFYRPEFNLVNKVIGKSSIYLNGTYYACRYDDCKLGNLITDSMLYARRKQLASLNRTQDAVVALCQAGGIKGSINEGDIKIYDILNVLPYNNTLVVANITGQRILDAMEHSASFYDSEENGGYLQFSGLQVIFDVTQPRGQRVHSVKIRCMECDGYEIYKPLELNKTYTGVFTIFLFNGGDEYKWTDAEIPLSVVEKMDYTDLSAFQEYIQDFSPIINVKTSRQRFII